MPAIGLEVRVVGGDQRCAPAPCDMAGGGEGGEGRMDVDDVDPAQPSPRDLGRSHQPPGADHAVLRIEGNSHPAGAGDGFNLVARDLGAVARGDDPHRMAAPHQFVAEHANRRRHPVDAREVDVGDHQDPHAAMVSGAPSSQRQRSAISASPKPSDPPARTSVG